jgi:hypothetical protein
MITNAAIFAMGSLALFGFMRTHYRYQDRVLFYVLDVIAASALFGSALLLAQ